MKSILDEIKHAWNEGRKIVHEREAKRNLRISEEVEALKAIQRELYEIRLMLGAISSSIRDHTKDSMLRGGG